MTVPKVEDLSDVLDQARARHPGWRFWISSARRYWVTRPSNVQIAELCPAGWAMTIDADSLEKLEEGVEEQNALSSHSNLALHGSRPDGKSADR